MHWGSMLRPTDMVTDLNHKWFVLWLPAGYRPHHCVLVLLPYLDRHCCGYLFLPDQDTGKVGCELHTAGSISAAHTPVDLCMSAAS
jgi:hypothetical protein